MCNNGRKLFGTDGVRGVANSYPMEAPVALKLGQAIAAVFRDVPGLGRIVIGKDTRLSGYVLESALVAGICSMGMDAMLVGPLPSPGIAFIAHSMRAHAGVMVSASHNPVEYNGIKFFDNEGFKLADDLELKMEKLIFENRLDAMRPGPEDMGKAYRIDDAGGRYIQYLKGTFPQNLTLEGIKIVVDCANGAGYKVAPTVFGELGAEVITTAVQPNGLNINCDCGALNPERMSKLVLEHGANVGVALDGDADRVIMCDEKGRLIDGDAVLAICALHLHGKGNLARDKVVGTEMSNQGLQVMLAKNGIELIRTNVGDRYVMEVMRREKLNLGGEPSGHVIFLHHTTSGDGTLAALRVLSIMCQQQRPLSDVAGIFTAYPQVVRNVKVRERKPLGDMPGLSKMTAAAQKAFEGRGRLLVRYSGTENIVRVMVEGEKLDEIERVASEIACEIEKEIGIR